MNNRIILSSIFVILANLLAAGSASAQTWTTTTVDSSGDVGYYTSIALDSSGKAHISYFDNTNRDLKYATNASGSWVTTTVDSSGYVGMYTSIKLDSSGKAYISYSDNTNYDLKYATNASGSWVTTTVDSTGNVGYYTSIALDSSGKAYISYLDNSNYYLKYATNASGSWVATTVDSTPGWYTSIVLDSSGKAYISYYDSSYGYLKYATNASGSWVATTVDSSGNMGRDNTSIALDSSGKAYISYYDYTNYDLKYATNASGSWVTTTVDSAGNVGYQTSIALDSSGKAYISYFDNTNGDLKYTTNASGSWVTTTVDSTGNVGQYTSIALDSSGKAYISYYDNTNFDLKYATNATSSSAPTVTTSSATSVTTSSATLNGTVNANGASTTAWFDYGTASRSYTGSSTTQAVSGSSDTAISIGLSGLSAGTTYYYRIAAYNSAGTSYGSETMFTTSSPPPAAEPPPKVTLTVTSVSPSNGATSVGTNTAVTATFSDNMNGSTLTTDTFILRGGGNDVAGSVGTNGNKATFTPSAGLAYDTTYTATITTGAQAANYAGTTLDANYSWSFTTESAPVATTTTTTTTTTTSTTTTTQTDTTAPDGSLAINNGAGYTNSRDVTLSLSATDNVGITGYFLSTSPSLPPASASGWTSLSSATSYTGNVSYTLSSGDGSKTLYVCYKDAAGNASNAAGASITLDTTAPAIMSASPAHDAASVAINTPITAAFSEIMNTTTIGTSTFFLSGGRTGSVATNTGTATTATFTPSKNLAYNTTYTATITNGVKDLAGNAMTSNKTWSFTTGLSARVTLTPTVTPTPTVTDTPSVTPTPGASPTPETIAADFTANPTAGKKPLTVQFTDQSVGAISGWKWNFGDGATDTAQNPSHTYTTKGNYTVSLAVSGPYGSNTKTINNYITVTDKKTAIIADFTATPTTGELPLTVQFTEQCVGDITSMSWDFGDDTTSAGKNPMHVYGKAGKYTVQHTAKGEDGSNTKTVKNYITVTQKHSGITLALSPSEITFGESLTLNGQISPSIKTDVTITFTSETDETDTVTVTSDTDGSFSLKEYFPPAGGSWSVAASWDGNDEYSGSESDPEGFTANPAKTEFTIESSSSTIQFDQTVNITGTVTLTPDNETTRNRFQKDNLKLIRTNPEGKYEDVIKTQPFHVSGDQLQYTFAEVALPAIGGWDLLVGFDRDESFLGINSSHIEIEVQDAPKDTAGYVILVEGGVKGRSGMDTHNLTTNYIYQKLLERGFKADDIYYFNFDTSQYGVDKKPSGDNIVNAIKTWASGKMNTSPAPLYLIFAGHGDKEKFYVYPDTLTADSLASALSSLESTLNSTASKEAIVVVLGANYSGSFINKLSKSGTKRILVASSDTKEVACKGPLPPDKTIRHGDYFTFEFINYAARGKSIKKSYELAANEIAEFTENKNGNGLKGASAGNGQYFDDSAQHPLLDDNGDGVGTYGALSSLSGKDGELSANIIMGKGTTTTALELTGVTEVITLNAEDNSPALFARVNDTSRVDTVWAEIASPNYTLKNDSGVTEQQVIDLPGFNSQYNETEQKYVLNDFSGSGKFKNFNEAGKYGIFYFAQDNQTGAIAPFMTSDVFKNSKNNEPPTAFKPVFPVQGTETAVALKFDWEDSTDPDGNAGVTYTITVSPDKDFNTVYYHQEGLTDSVAVVDKKASFRDGTTYYWKVLADDVDGGTTIMETSAAYSKITGYAKDKNGDPVESAEISVRRLTTSSEKETTSNESGFFEFNELESGKYLLKAHKELYRKYYKTLMLEDGVTEELEIIMKRSNTGNEGEETLSIGQDDRVYENNIDDGLSQGDASQWPFITDLSGTSADDTNTISLSSFTAKLANGFPGFVKGYIFDKATNATINNATIEVKGTNGSYTTTKSGAYFLQLNSGTYTVSVEASGYETSAKTVRVDALSTTTENIALAVNTKTSTISGQVTAKKTGELLEGTTITVKKKGVKETTTTGSDGSYSITGLESGQYNLTAKKQRYETGKTKIKLDANREKTLDIKLKKMQK